MIKYDIVIARYNENINWVEELNDLKFNIKVYNKGNKNIDIDSIQLENIGRDPHTFITYIVDNYYDMPDYVVFLQGNPFDHCGNVIEKIKNHNNDDYVCLSDHIVDESIISWYDDLIEPNIILPTSMRRYSLLETSNAILGNETPNAVKFSAGQQYIIDKKYILNRDIKFYKNILKRFEIDFLLPWHIERLWFNIFKL